MNGHKAKQLRNAVNGNPLKQEREYTKFGNTLVNVGARRQYRLLKRYYINNESKL